MLIGNYKFEQYAYPTTKDRVSHLIDRGAERMLRGMLRAFAVGILARAKEDGVLTNDQLHELAARLDKRLGG